MRCPIELKSIVGAPLAIAGVVSRYNAKRHIFVSLWFIERQADHSHFYFANISVPLARSRSKFPESLAIDEPFNHPQRIIVASIIAPQIERKGEGGRGKLFASVTRFGNNILWSGRRRWNVRLKLDEGISREGVNNLVERISRKLLGDGQRNFSLIHPATFLDGIKIY